MQKSNSTLSMKYISNSMPQRQIDLHAIHTLLPRVFLFHIYSIYILLSLSHLLYIHFSYSSTRFLALSFSHFLFPLTYSRCPPFSHSQSKLKFLHCHQIIYSFFYFWLKNYVFHCLKFSIQIHCVWEDFLDLQILNHSWRSVVQMLKKLLAFGEFKVVATLKIS